MLIYPVFYKIFVDQDPKTDIPGIYITRIDKRFDFNLISTFTIPRAHLEWQSEDPLDPRDHQDKAGWTNPSPDHQLAAVTSPFSDSMSRTSILNLSQDQSELQVRQD